MPDQKSLIRTGVFMSVGYLCAGITVAILASIGLWSDFIESSVLLCSITVIVAFIIGIALGVLFIRYLVPRYNAKQLYEQDILVCMIGLLFIALAINQAMLLLGVTVASGALCVFFYENFNRQLHAARFGMTKALQLSGWGVGPVIAFIVLTALSQYGLIVCRLLFAHYIAIAFWIWIQRLSIHEQYEDAPIFLLPRHKSGLKAKEADDKKDLEKGEKNATAEDKDTTLRQDKQ